MFEVRAKKDGDTCDTAENKCVAGAMPQNGRLYFDIRKCGNQTIKFDENGQAFAEIKDGLEIELAKGTASEILLSDKEVYKGLREKFVITIEIIPEDMTVYENAVNVKFEDKHKYYERMQARYGRV